MKEIEPAFPEVGTEIHYSGDIANESGKGAIVAATMTSWNSIRYYIVLEDGRKCCADPHSFDDSPGCRLKLGTKVLDATEIAVLVAFAEACEVCKKAAEAARISDNPIGQPDRR